MSETVLMVAQLSWKAGLAACYKRAFEAVGLRVVGFDLEQRRAAAAPLGPLGYRVMGHVDLSVANARANRFLVMEALKIKPKIIVVVCNEAVRAATLVQLKIAAPGAHLINIFPDALFNLRESAVQCLPLYDAFFTHTRAGVPHLARLGARAVHLPLAADPSLHHPEEMSLADRRTYGCDVVYVGNWRSEHEALFDALSPLDIAIWGSNWNRSPNKDGFSRSRWRGRPLHDPTEFAKAHLAAKIGLNPLDPLNLPSHNQRVFELPACAAFSLVTRTEEILEIFREGESIACFEGEDELRDKIRHYLSHPEERRKIADAAYDLVVKGGHTYVDRVRAILKTLGEEALIR